MVALRTIGIFPQLGIDILSNLSNLFIVMTLWGIGLGIDAVDQEALILLLGSFRCTSPKHDLKSKSSTIRNLFCLILYSEHVKI